MSTSVTQVELGALQHGLCDVQVLRSLLPPRPRNPEWEKKTVAMMKLSMEERRPPLTQAHQTRDDGFESHTVRESSRETNEEIMEIEMEESELLPYGEQKASSAHRRAWTTPTTILAALNLCLMTALVVIWTTSAENKSSCIDVPEPPYSPLYEDGAVKYVNKVFHPEDLFQSEPSDEVDAAWDAAMGSTDGLVKLPEKSAARLPETVKLFFDPGYFAYGVSAFHQLHCLNRIRKTFYADRYFHNETQEKIAFHKNHCIDLLRQAIMCNGDPSMVYWWNSNYSYVDDNGVKHYTQEYLSRNDVERAEGSFVKWEVSTRCRDWDALNDWTEKNSVDKHKYLEAAMSMDME